LSSFYALRRLLSILALLTLDAFALFAGLILASYSVSSGSGFEEILRLAPVLLAMWLVVFAAHDLYDRASTRRNPVALLRAILSGSGLLVIGDLLYPKFGLVLEEILVGTLFVLLLEIGMRSFYEQGIELFYRQKLGLIPILLVGEDKASQQLRWAMKKLTGSYTSVGELSFNDEGVNLRTLRQELDHTGARQVIVLGAEHFPEAKFLELLRACRLRRVGVKVVPSTVTLELAPIGITSECNTDTDARSSGESLKLPEVKEPIHARHPTIDHRADLGTVCCPPARAKDQSSAWLPPSSHPRQGGLREAS
jgi:FlaA1/EpsC-like NDP-sugar epimerase